MAIYSTFFVSQPVDLQGGFPTWRPPLPQPVKREIINPFTRKAQIIETREPEWPASINASPPATGYQVVSVQGSYADYLEGRLPPFVRGCPHWNAKGLTTLELEPLAEAAGVQPIFDTPLYSPAPTTSTLNQFSPALISKLAAADENGALEIATRWSATLSTPEHTHSVTGHKIHDGPTIDEMLAIVRPIRELALQATKGQDIYLLNEW